MDSVAFDMRVAIIVGAVILSSTLWWNLHLTAEFMNSIPSFFTKAQEKVVEREVTNNQGSPSTGHYCTSTGTLDGIALEMMNYSSPQGSLSFHKIQRVLCKSSHYDASSITNGLFLAAKKNIVLALEGYGLKVIAKNSNETALLVEDAPNGESVKRTTTWFNQPRIILQTEQLLASSVWSKYGPYLTDCHKSPLCLILDFSDTNYREGVRRGIANSMLLLPFLIQDRLGDMSAKAKPMNNRSISSVFFGSMLPRRKAFQKMAQNYSFHETMKFSTEGNSANMVAAYVDAKICLIIHAYIENCGAEYHRISEVVTSGCQLVVESTGDVIGRRQYQECGGVVFADYNNLLPTVENVLSLLSSKDSERRMRQRIEWWKASIQWNQSLTHFPCIGNI